MLDTRTKGSFPLSRSLPPPFRTRLFSCFVVLFLSPEIQFGFVWACYQLLGSVPPLEQKPPFPFVLSCFVQAGEAFSSSPLLPPVIFFCLHYRIEVLYRRFFGPWPFLFHWATRLIFLLLIGSSRSSLVVLILQERSGTAL